MAQEGTRLYVGNLPYVASKTDIEELFTKNNMTIKNISMSVDPFTGQNPSYCFVDFHSAEDAAAAMQNVQGQDVGGRGVRINATNERKNTKDRTPQSQQQQRPRDYRGWKAPGATSEPSSSPYTPRDQQQQQQQQPQPNPRVFIGNLPPIESQEVLHAEIRKLFEGCEVKWISKLMAPKALEDPEQPSNDGTDAQQRGHHHFCFAELPSAEEAAEAAEALNGKPRPGGGTYKVRVSRRLPGRMERDQQQGAQGEAATPTKTRDFSASWRRKD